MTNDFFQIAVDTGGTFTDCIAIAPNAQIKTCKVLSNSSLRGSITEWIDSKTLRVQNNWQVERDIFQQYEFRILNHSNFESIVYKIESYDCEQKIIYLNQSLPIDFQGLTIPFEISACEEPPILAARLITQTALNEPFPSLKMRIGSTKGTNALLERKGAKTGFIVTKGFKDLLTIKNQQRPALFALNIQKSAPLYTEVAEIEERLNADGSVLKALIINDLNKIIRRFKKQQITSVAVALMHSYCNPEHEILIKNVLEQHFQYVSISSELSQQIKFVPRAETTVVNAYLAPILDNYINNIVAKCPNDSLQVMTSAGSLVHAKQFHPKDSLLSGPAGGIIGAATVGRQSGFHKLITFDMGGTSTDVARFDTDYDYKFDVTIGDATVFSPALMIETFASGGGSICYFDGYKLGVGPKSAGAYPGPACYGAGGCLTITDVNLLLGRLDASQFGIPIFKAAATHQLALLQAEIVEKTHQPMSKEAILQGFLDIANERMADAIKKISIAKGYSPAQYALIAFGGAGGLHACNMAEMLHIDTVLLPQHAGLLSAYGILNAQMERFAEKQILKTVSQITWESLENEFQILSQQAIEKVVIDGVLQDKIYIKKQIMFVRLKGQDATLECVFDKDFQKHFKTKYETIYGHWIDNRAIEIESIRVIAAEKADFQHVTPSDIESKSYVPIPNHFTEAFVSNQWQTIPVFFRNHLKIGATLKGFALVLDPYSTTVVEQGFEFTIDAQNTAIMKRIQKIQSNKNQQAKTIDLELFTNRFRNIAENMGVLLQRTALSVNVKERLDFSCALLDANGYLIANAPNIPVHLGSLGVCVRTVLKDYILNDGDTIVTNHPKFGGSHLPDVTLITPVFAADKQLIGYVCNRCHHAEIGGIRPASMPPNATRLIEEGVIIAPMYLVKNGVIDWESIRCKLTQSIYPSRSVGENLADLNAALAANLNGVQGLQALVRAQGLEKVHFYMDLLQQYSADKLKEHLMSQFKMGDYEAIEKLDDGTVLKVKISLNDKIVFDFTGTSAVHQGNLNATPAIVNSVVIYVLRLLLNENIPLNEGIMRNVILILPENSILNPVFSDNSAICPAVVGGNVETSQRLTDTLLKALGVAACSQGTMNNTLFGNETYGYYETVCGGAGATDGFQGADAVHTHMTNTRITDPEIMEFRYPVRLDEFSVRKNSGGKGLYRGGDGIVRKITFLAPVELSILSQHRILAPYGLKGGRNGKRGKQFLVLKDKTIQKLNGNAGTKVEMGEQLVMQTPGGGGYEKPF
jgi:5-oxoprolinase (ATP-hydrolysing)